MYSKNEIYCLTCRKHSKGLLCPCFHSEINVACFNTVNFLNLSLSRWLPPPHSSVHPAIGCSTWTEYKLELGHPKSSVDHLGMRDISNSLQIFYILLLALYISIKSRSGALVTLCKQWHVLCNHNVAGKTCYLWD